MTLIDEIKIKLPPTTLGLFGLSRLLILGHLEELVGQALLVGTVSLTQLRNVHHGEGRSL